MMIWYNDIRQGTHVILWHDCNRVEDTICWNNITNTLFMSQCDMTWYDISGQQNLIWFEFRKYDLILLFCFDVFLCWLCWLLYATCCLLTLSHSFVQTSYFEEWYVLFSDMIIQCMFMAYIYCMLTTCDTIKSRAIPGPHQFARSLHR